MSQLRRCHVCFNVHQGADVDRCPACLSANRRADPWVEAYLRSLALQGRWQPHDDHVSVSEPAVDRETESADDLRAVRPPQSPGANAEAGTPVIPGVCGQCGDDWLAHVKAPYRDHWFFRATTSYTRGNPPPTTYTVQHDYKFLAANQDRVLPRTPGSTRDKSYWRQVWETIAACASFAGLGAVFCWLWHA